MNHTFLLYHNYKAKLDKLTDAELREIINAIFDYEMTGNEPAFSTLALEMLWSFIRDNLDRDKEKYRKTCEKNKKNGEKGGAPAGNRNAQKQPKTTDDTQNNRSVEKQAQTSETTQNKRNKPIDNDNDNDNEYDNDLLQKESKKPRGGYDGLISAYTQDEKLRGTLTEYIKMRVKKKAAPTDHALTLIFADLDRLAKSTADKITILENSIKNNWTGVFALECKNKSAPKGAPAARTGASEQPQDTFGRNLI